MEWDRFADIKNRALKQTTAHNQRGHVPQRGMRPFRIVVQLDELEDLLPCLQPRLEFPIERQFPLQSPVEGFHDRVVIRAPFLREGLRKAMFRQLLRVTSRRVLASAVRVHQKAFGRVLPCHGAVQSGDDKVLVDPTRHLPAHDLPREQVEIGCQVEPAFLRRQARDVAAACGVPAVD